ncbi:hypothetical protein F511_39972 [Dorcoceras hygrometricum]|uniref:Uncharacterized protein n=1 Tax=Dorcoceras hygrometricum TaxID=472368 RepID=A0A2Z7CYS9_9LAMI|nr:hypothetical protein F511_39972 [Dorcoceras hygrometricum]
MQHMMSCNEGYQEIIGNQGTTTQLENNISVNHRNPKYNDSAGNHDSVKPFEFHGTTTQPANHGSVIKSNSQGATTQPTNHDSVIILHFKARRLSRKIMTQ